MADLDGWLEVENTVYCPTCAFRHAIREQAQRNWTIINVPDDIDAVECDLCGVTPDEFVPSTDQKEGT
jgi:hypothetical protein